MRQFGPSTGRLLEFDIQLLGVPHDRAQILMQFVRGLDPRKLR
jgi:hypothetical protein